MPDPTDIKYIEQDLAATLREAEEICQGLIDTAKAYNTQEGEQIYDIDQLENQLEKIRAI